MSDLYCFAAVEFPEDENVAGRKYWYLCDELPVKVGDRVSAPLGRHNNLSSGVIRAVIYANEFEAPYPVHLIKHIKNLEIKE